MQLTNDDVEVNLATGEADPEFSEWKWASPEEVIEEASCKHLFSRVEFIIYLFEGSNFLLTGYRQWTTRDQPMKKL